MRSIMYYILLLTSGVFFIAIRKIYYYAVYNSKSQSIKTVFLLLSILASIFLNILTILTAGNYSLPKMIIMLSSNFLVDFLLSLFFSAKNIAYRIVTIICYEVILALSECFAGGLLLRTFSIYVLNERIQDSIVCVLSSILSFLFICMFSLVWKRTNQKIIFAQMLITCVTPICSILFILFLPYQAFVSLGRENHIYLTFMILIILNCLNYFFLDNFLHQKELQDKLQSQEAQLSFQTEKFNQLSNAYKGVRRITHEIQHRDKYLITCMKNNDFKTVEKELSGSLSSFETRFFESSTHNLVIDTFVSSYTSMANEKRIPFQTEIKIDKSLIPLSDYDLCIILGNLFDNCFNAAENWNTKKSNYNDFYIKCHIATQDKFFVIHFENPSESEKEKKSKDVLKHGYGLINVKKMVKKYNGFYNQEENESTYSTTISIPITYRYDNLSPVDNSEQNTTPPRLSKRPINKGF